MRRIFWGSTGSTRMCRWRCGIAFRNRPGGLSYKSLKSSGAPAAQPSSLGADSWLPGDLEIARAAHYQEYLAGAALGVVAGQHGDALRSRGHLEGALAQVREVFDFEIGDDVAEAIYFED